MIQNILAELGIKSHNPATSTGNHWMPGTGVIESYSPVDGALIGTVANTTREEYEAMMQSASEAFKTWRLMPAPKRGEIVRQLGEALREEKQALGQLVSYEMGKSLQEGLGEVQEMIDICDFAVGLSRQLYGLTMHSERPSHRMYEQWHPMGIVGIISAFNFPVAVWSWNAALAWVCGNVTIWKPSEKTPICGNAVQNIVAKVFKKNKEGLSGKFKVVGQIGLGIIVGLTMYFNQHIKVREFAADGTFVDHKSLLTTVPFMKDNQFDYNMLLPSFIPDEYVWIVYVLVVIFIITAVSNGANITDGIDGLAAGISVIIGIALAILAYVSGNKVISQYLNVMFIPNSGELAVFCAAFVGACIGFLWYNAYPAQVFMGDTGSLALGGAVAAVAIIIKMELLLPILCGVFLAESGSVILQVSYFKYTKKRFGEGKRIFLMSPLHHHYQKKGLHESKIVTRFWISGIFLAIFTLITLKLR